MFYLEESAKSATVYLQSARDMAWLVPLLESYKVVFGPPRRRAGRIVLDLRFGRARTDREMESAVACLRVLQSAGIEMEDALHPSGDADNGESQWFVVDLMDDVSNAGRLSAAEVAVVLEARKKKNV